MEGRIEPAVSLRSFLRKTLFKSTFVVLFSFASVILTGTFILARESFISSSRVQAQIFFESLRQDFLLGSYASLNQKCRNSSKFDGVVSVAVGNDNGDLFCHVGDSKTSDFLVRNAIFFDEDHSVQAGWVEISFRDSFKWRFLKLSFLSALVCSAVVVFVFIRFSKSFEKLVILPLDEIKKSLSARFVDEHARALSLRGHIVEIKFIQKAVNDFKNSAIEHEKLQIMSVRDAAIARTTQSLAHDVRRPFSMLKSIIQVVEATEDPVLVKEVLNETLPEVNQAMASVEGMIQDVMQIGSEAKLCREEVAPHALLESAVHEVCQVFPQAEANFTYDFGHTYKTFVDAHRVNRVFANIIGNAIEAMREKGSIWIRTSQKDGFVEFVIGNEKSFIPSEMVSKLFDAFFTSGKKGGTGLGLAIAKKIVEAHGGAISCRSEKSEQWPVGMVEFVFTLPCCAKWDLGLNSALPQSSRQIREEATRRRMASLHGATKDPLENELEQELDRLLTASLVGHQKFNILLVDDEGVYREGMRCLLSRFSRVGRHIEFCGAASATEGLAIARGAPPKLIFVDVDLGDAGMNGLDVVRSLREEGFRGYICVHSNRFLFEDNKAALEAGANAFLPKPIGPTHFLKLLQASLTSA